MSSLNNVKCDFCRKTIPFSDFEAGRAVVLLKKNYCRACMADAIQRSKTLDIMPEFVTPRPVALRSRKGETKRRPPR
ncbi:MAG TPA: hypothetical protein VJB14_11210 [Planctomycetota bacterium]|nr:hypothetical protein [Planctomycetota bacterium]